MTLAMSTPSLSFRFQKPVGFDQFRDTVKNVGLYFR